MSKTIQPPINDTINHGRPVGWKYTNPRCIRYHLKQPIYRPPNLLHNRITDSRVPVPETMLLASRKIEILE